MSRRQELNDWRNTIKSIQKSVSDIRSIDNDPESLSYKEIVDYIKHLEREKVALTVRINDIRKNGGNVPKSIIDALRLADNQLKSIAKDYRSRKELFSQAIGKDQLKKLRRLDITKNTSARIKQYLNDHPEIPEGVDDYL
ncbi:MAG: hypothetical protein EOP45_17865, partial [Sphingobacteriaceae bacterium]